ncbi:MAG: response regulator [Methanoregula sp.]
MQRKILILEDDQPILELMEMMIRKLGYEPVLITNGLEALELIKQESPALILLDIMMVPINGWEFLEKLRGEFGKREIPVILFTASPMVDERMAELKDPYLSVLTKPVSFAELKAGIAQFLG